jgi:hypothetical protein
VGTNQQTTTTTGKQGHTARRTSHTIPRHYTAQRSQKSDTRLAEFGRWGQHVTTAAKEGNINARGPTRKGGRLIRTLIFGNQFFSTTIRAVCNCEWCKREYKRAQPKEPKQNKTNTENITGPQIRGGYNMSLSPFALHLPNTPITTKRYKAEQGVVDSGGEQTGPDKPSTTYQYFWQKGSQQTMTRPTPWKQVQNL